MSRQTDRQEVEGGRVFTVTVPRDYTFREGFGVLVDPIHHGDNDDGADPDGIVDIDVTVVVIREELVRVIGGVPCVPLPFEAANSWAPVEIFTDGADPRDTADDTHDFRARWFATRDEAEDHARYTRERWENPAPWESFVELGG